eukprot:9898147-Prorocentrum_lima.AAC.1
MIQYRGKGSYKEPGTRSQNGTPDSSRMVQWQRNKDSGRRHRRDNGNINGHKTRGPNGKSTML